MLRDLFNTIILLIKLISLWLAVYVRDPAPLVYYTMLTVFTGHYVQNAMRECDNFFLNNKNKL